MPDSDPCDNQESCGSTGEVRLLTFNEENLHRSSLIVCKGCYRKVIRNRRQEAQKRGEIPYCPAWESLSVYTSKD